jgi:hypothetical protein
MDIPKDDQIERLVSDATHIATRSNHPLAWRAVQQLQKLRAPLHTQVERSAAFDAVMHLYVTPGFTSSIYHPDGRVEDAYDSSQDDLDDLMMALERYMDNDAIAAEAASFGRISFDEAIDQQAAYPSLDEALCSSWENAADTLDEIFGVLRGDIRYDNAWRAMERAFRAKLTEHGLKCLLFI